MIYDEPESSKFIAVVQRIKQLRRRAARRHRLLKQRLRAILRRQK